jgi:hypothetical protein
MFKVAPSPSGTKTVLNVVPEIRPRCNHFWEDEGGLPANPSPR